MSTHTEPKSETDTETETEARTDAEARPDEVEDVEDVEEQVKEAKEAKEKDETEQAPEETRKKGWLSQGNLLRAVGVLVLVAALVTAGMQWRAAEQAAQREDDRRAVRERAGEFGRALLSYDHTKLDAARKKVLSLASDDFAKTYDVAFTGGLEGVITKLKANATATVRNVYLEEVGSASARAVVVMDSKVHSTAGTRRVLGSYLDMRLTRQDGRWRITEVNAIGAMNESMTDPGGETKDKAKDQGGQEGVPGSPGG